MLLGLFLVGTLWFWMLMAVAAVIIGVCVARESFGKATLSVITTFVLLGILGDFNVLHWLKGHASEFAVYLAAYFAIGTVWSVVKWWFFVRRERDKFDKLKAGFLRAHTSNGNVIPDELKTEWFKQIDGTYGYGYDDDGKVARRRYPPHAGDCKGKITAWMAYWPWSLLITLVDDPIRKIFNAIFKAIQGVFQRISDNAFKDVEADFAPSAPKAPAPTGGNGNSRTPSPNGPDDDGVSRVRLI